MTADPNLVRSYEGNQRDEKRARKYVSTHPFPPKPPAPPFVSVRTILGGRDKMIPPNLSRYPRKPPPPPPTPKVTVYLQDEGEPWKTLKWVLLVVTVVVVGVGIYGGFVTW